MSKRRKMTKAESERWHFKKAIRRRYGIFCNRFLYKKLLYYVTSGSVNSSFILKDTNTRTIHKISLSINEITDSRSSVKIPLSDGVINIYVVYDKLRQELVTAPPWCETDKQFIAEYNKMRGNKNDRRY